MPLQSKVHVRDSVRQIDSNSWLVGSKHVIHRRLDKSQQNHLPGYQHLWGDQHVEYVLYDAPHPLPPTTALPGDSHVRQIHDAGDASAVFRFGDALILKAKLRLPQRTPYEHETIAFLSKLNLSFKVPRVLFHAQEDNTAFLLETRIHGQTVNEAWWDMSPSAKEQVATRVAEIVQELSAFRSDTFTSAGIDCNWINPLVEDEDRDHAREVLIKHCESLGMDCSTYVFSHNDLGPTNVIVDGEDVSIIDWEMAGYCPLEWVRTKFAVCGVMDVERVWGEGPGRKIELDQEYRKLIEQKLGVMGFPEVTEAYGKIKKERREEWVKRRPWLQV